MLQQPVSVTFWTEDNKKNIFLEGKSEARWNDIRLEMIREKDQTKIRIAADGSLLCYVSIRFKTKIDTKARILGDEWERTYGDMAWQPMIPHRRLPWYFLVTKDRETKAAGVKVRPGAMCFWQVDEEGVTLVLDVRCGGRGVALNGRTLEAASLVWDEYHDMHSFEAARAFCRRMCTDGILPDAPVYGSNNWYYAYGISSREDILKDADYLKELTEGVENRPYLVIDDGWQPDHIPEVYNGGPWRGGNAAFGDMADLASEIVKRDAIPGIWLRLLLNEKAEVPEEGRLTHNNCLDPSHPAVKEYIREDIDTLCRWGYRLIKHDFSTYDLSGKWGNEMRPFPTHDGWSFYDTGRTTAEIIVDFYRLICETARPYRTLILGCNTIGHLGAGLMHLNRTGDDTSGHFWDMTRKNGINALAFRMPQQGIFYDIDADCVGIMGEIDWKWNRQWSDLLAGSGTSFFVSARPGLLEGAEVKEMKKFMEIASRRHDPAVPVDWEDTSCPKRWIMDGQEKEYQWYTDIGIQYGDPGM